MAYALTYLVAFVLVTIAALIIIGLVGKQALDTSRDLQKTLQVSFDIIERQALLISSKDPMTYQALRAADSFGSYDEVSKEPDIEEIIGGFGADGDPEQEVEFNGDPFVSGNIFDKKL